MDRNNGKPSFMHIQNLRMARAAPSTISADRLTLDNVSAYNVDVDTGDSRTSSIITLREVPSFLIEAFSRIWCLDGCKVEGIFRKEGAAARTKEGSLPVFFGAEPIPKNFLVHDICSWIKRFFRDLKQPLFRDREHILLDFANTFPTIERRDELFTTLMTILDRIPASHMGALGYLMRCLQEISEEASVHHMTVENLATVFAPAIFRDHVLEQKPMKKSRSGSQDNMLSEVKRINELKVLVIQVMIENAEKIIVPKDCYKATRRPSDLKKKERGFIASSVQKNGRLRVQKEISADIVPEDPIVAKPTMMSPVKSYFESSQNLCLDVDAADVYIKPKDSVLINRRKPKNEIAHEKPPKTNVHPSGTTVMLHKGCSRNFSPSIKRSTDGSSHVMNIESLFNKPNDLRFLLEVAGRPSLTQIQGSGIVHQRIEQFNNKENEANSIHSKLGFNLDQEIKLAEDMVESEEDRTWDFRGYMEDKKTFHRYIDRYIRQHVNDKINQKSLHQYVDRYIKQNEDMLIDKIPSEVLDEFNEAVIKVKEEIIGDLDSICFEIVENSKKDPQAVLKLFKALETDDEEYIFQPRLLLIFFLTFITVLWTLNAIIGLVTQLFIILFTAPAPKTCPHFFWRDNYCEPPLPFHYEKRIRYGEAYLSEFCGNGVAVTFKCHPYFEACQLSNSWGGLKLLDSDNLPTACSNIKDRQYFPLNPLSTEEAHFPIAYAKTVKRDYYFLEMELASTYAPQNLYCYSIDKNATTLFKERMRNLANCLPNVYIGTKEYDLEGGDSQLYAYLNCIKQLVNHKWKYVIFLENHDVAVKTNAEIVEILKMFNGSNEIAINRIPSYTLNGDWSFKNIQLMKKEYKNEEFKRLRLAQGDLQSAWSRQAIDYILEEINIVHVTENFKNETTYGMDRVFLSSLQITEDVKLPGGFTDVCLDRGFETNSILRYVYYPGKSCESGIIKNGLCIGGRSNLRFIEKMPHMFFSVMDPQQEFVAYQCWRERMFNKTYSPERLPPAITLEPYLHHYVNNTIVRLNRERLDSHFRMDAFSCE